ncbi:uncharacterized protein [Ptychodera flava]|uniref:uncharacterized protein n=1 Tax=Ptychodera flava TaxID=63121 RepID=UPI003969FACB
MSLFKKKGEEAQSILHPEIDPWETSTPRLVYIRNMSTPLLCAVISLLLIVVALVTTAAVFIVCAYKPVGEMEGIIIIIGPSGRQFDSLVYVNEDRQVERLIVPLVGERDGRPIRGKATVVHDFEAGYTAYSLFPGDGEGACFVSKLNRSYIKYDLGEMVAFLTEYQNQTMRRTPEFSVTYSADHIEEIFDLSVFKSPDIEQTCQGQRSYLLGPGKITADDTITGRVGRKRRDLPCILDILVLGADIKIGCPGREREPEPDFSEYFDYDFADELEL